MPILDRYSTEESELKSSTNKLQLEFDRLNVTYYSLAGEGKKLNETRDKALPIIEELSVANEVKDK